jgi:hypothetical protein
MIDKYFGSKFNLAICLGMVVGVFGFIFGGNPSFGSGILLGFGIGWIAFIGRADT